MKILQCEDSVDGIFSAVYYAWESGFGHDNIRIEFLDEEVIRLFAEYIPVKTNLSQSVKVSRTLKKQFGVESYEHIYQAALSQDREKAEAIYRVILMGLSLQDKNRVMDCLNNRHVLKVFQLSCNVWNETHRMLGFIRFAQLDNGVFFAKINPKNNILTLLTTHFSNRLAGEDFIIYDESRKISLLHPRNREAVLVSGNEVDLERITRISKEEELFSVLWKSFFESISIKERKNYELQRNMLPKRYRGEMLEFLS